MKISNALIFFIFLILSCNLKEEKSLILSGYSDGVMHSTDIRFYDNNTFEYCSLRFLGEKCYRGIYKRNKEIIVLRYNDKKPRLDAEKIKIEDKHLIFLDENDEGVYQFYIESQYLD